MRNTVVAEEIHVVDCRHRPDIKTACAWTRNDGRRQDLVHGRAHRLHHFRRQTVEANHSRRNWTGELKSGFCFLQNLHVVRLNRNNYRRHVSVNRNCGATLTNISFKFDLSTFLLSTLYRRTEVPVPNVSIRIAGRDRNKQGVGAKTFRQMVAVVPRSNLLIKMQLKLISRMPPPVFHISSGFSELYQLIITTENSCVDSISPFRFV